MWPFTKPKAARPSRSIPTPPFVDVQAWAHVGGTVSAMSPRQAESLAAVLAAVNAIAGTVASLPAYVTRADDARSEAPDHPLQRLIDYGPNESESWSDFVEGLLASCLLRGNALAEVETDARGRLVGLHTLPWSQVTPYVGDDGVLLFDFIPVLPPRAGQVRRYLRQDCLFVKDRADNGQLGVSRLSRAAGALQIALNIQMNASQFMANAARPSGALTAPGKVSDTTANRLATEWDENYTGNRVGKTAVLPEGLKWEPLSLLSAEEAQLVANRNFSVADVSRIFGVPPFMLADPSRSTFASAKEGSRHFAMTCLTPWVSKVQRAFAQSVLSSQYRLVIDLGDLLRADPEARWASWQRARQAGVLSPNDVRGEEGWPASTDPTAASIEPPAAGGKPATDQADDPSTPAPAPAPTPTDDPPPADKVARLDQRRARHGDD